MRCRRFTLHMSGFCPQIVKPAFFYYFCNDCSYTIQCHEQVDSSGGVNRLFFRFFVLVMLSITAATFVIYFVFARLFGDPLEDIARRQASAQIFLLEQYVDRAPADEWLARLNKVREVSEAQFDLIPMTQ